MCVYIYNQVVPQAVALVGAWAYGFLLDWIADMFHESRESEHESHQTTHPGDCCHC